MRSDVRRQVRACLALAALTTVAAAAAVFGEGAEHPSAAAATIARPNIVLILLDDARRHDLTAAPSIKRRIGDKGVTLRNFYSSFPLCCPARATLLTGQYPHNHRVLSNEPPNGGWSGFRDSSTLATWLTPTYRTGLVGKYFNEYKVPYIPPGWDEWMVPKGMYNYTASSWLIDRGRGPAFRSITGYQTDTIGLLASRFIARNAPAAEPYFLYTSIVAPHDGPPDEPDDPVKPNGTLYPTPSVKPVYRDSEASARLTGPAFNEADISDKPVQMEPLTPDEIAALNETNQQRREAMHSVDDAVNTVMDAVKASGEGPNTYVMVMSDNGFILGEHRLRGGKVAPYEVSNHVPFVVRGPGIPAGRSLTAATAQVDFAPTVLRMAGLKIPESVDGVNLLPALRTGVPPARPGILLEAADIDATTSPPPWVYQGVVSDRWKYVERTSGSRELYDLRADPAELVNVADRPEYAGTQRRLARLLAGYRNCAGATCR